MRLLTLSFFCMLSTLCLAQRVRENNWITHINTWLNFDTSPAQLLTFPTYLTQFLESSSACISYKDGKLVLFADAGYLYDMKRLRRIYDYNFTNTSKIFIPFQNEDKYYLFQGNSYQIINTGSFPFQVSSPISLGNASKLYAIAHANTKDTWLIEEGGGNIYLIENDLPPVLKAKNNYLIPYGDWEPISVSPDLKYIIDHSIYRFDNNTGEISLIEENNIWSSAFSPDGKFIYIASMPEPGQHYIHQYEFSEGKISNPILIAGPDKIQTTFNFMHLGPDDKIYINNGNLHVISSPNERGEKCNLILNVIRLDLAQAWIIENVNVRWWARTQPSSISAMQICGSLATNFSTQTVNSTNIKSTRWNFGDGQSSTELAPTHTYEKAGVYHIQLDINKADNSTEILTKDIEVVALPAKLFIKW